MSTMPSKAELKKNLKLLKELLEARPMDLDARMRIARTYRLLDESNDAVAHYGAVARYLSLSGHPLQAIAVLKELLQIAPKHEETLLFLAKLYARTRAADVTNRGRVAVPILDTTTSATANDSGIEALHDGMPATPTGIWRAIRPTAIADLTVVRDVDDVGATVDEEAGAPTPGAASKGASSPGSSSQGSSSQGSSSPRPSKASSSTPPSKATAAPVADRHALASAGHTLSRHDEVLLHRVSLFAPLDISALTALGHAMVQLRADAGEVLFREGERGDSVLIVTRGVARATRDVADANGRHELVLRRFEPGDVIGMFALVDAGTRQATVTAETDLEYFEIDSTAVVEVIGQHPAARQALVQAVRERLLGSLVVDEPLFAALTRPERETLLPAFLDKQIEVGDDLFSDVDENDGLWIVAQGAVDLVDESAGDAVVTSLLVGDWVACVAGTLGTSAGLTARATASCAALTLPHKRLHGLLAERGGASSLGARVSTKTLRPAVFTGSLRR